MTVIAQALGGPLGRVVTWPEKASVSRDGNRVRLAVPGLGYRMLLVVRR